MVNKTKVLLEESNVISLRTAYVMDNGNEVTLSLDPALTSAPTTNIYKVEYEEWLKTCFIYLYRHMMDAPEENDLVTNPYSFAKHLMPLVSEGPPKLRLLWTDSGNSIVLYLNNEPWAFFDEGTCKGYSKGVLNPSAGNPWDHNLFEKAFGAGG